MQRQLKMKQLPFLLLVSSLLLISGCSDIYQLSTIKDDTKVEVVVSSIDDKIVTALKDATKEDCITLYKIFAGVASYSENSSHFTQTQQVFILLDKVEDDYGWNHKKYPDLTACIKDDLKSKNFATPKDIDGDIRKLIIDTFNGYAESCKKVAQGK
jgi:hypothetical protein